MQDKTAGQKETQGEGVVFVREKEKEEAREKEKKEGSKREREKVKGRRGKN